MKICVIGTGYVGLTTGIGLADFGCDVCCLDKDREKVNLLSTDKIPIYEPGMLEILNKNRMAGRLSFSIHAKEPLKGADIVIIAVGTPQREDGSAELSQVFEAAETIGQMIENYTVIATKSTVPVGTNEKIKKIIEDEICKRKDKSIEFDIVSNPEFLREGKALYDFLHPDRVVIGVEHERPIQWMKDLYRPLYLNEVPFIFTDLRTAETIKYSSNCFLAMKVAFINEMARFCDAMGADVTAVANAMGRDGRIGAKFLHPGPGYGGSCFPKDTQAMAYAGRTCGQPLSIIEAVIDSNERQRTYAAEKIIKELKNIPNPKIAVLGLAFKSETDDMRESPAITIIEKLLSNGISLSVYDPKAAENARLILGDRVAYCDNEYDAVRGCDGAAIVTEWNQFRNLDIKRIKAEMRGDWFFDLRNLYPRENVEAAGFIYIGMGR